MQKQFDGSFANLKSRKTTQKAYMWDTLEIRFALEVRQDLELSENIFKFCYRNKSSGGMKTKTGGLTRGKEKFLR